MDIYIYRVGTGIQGDIAAIVALLIIVVQHQHSKS